MKGCSGQSIVGVIVAIIAGALFLYTLIFAFKFQWMGGSMSASVFLYILALVFLAIAKVSKAYSHECVRPTHHALHKAPVPKMKKKR